MDKESTKRNDWLKRALKVLPIHITVIVMIIVGCAGSPLAVSMKSSEELKMVPSRQLCAAYAYSKSRKVKAELVARDLFDEREWRAIQAGDVFVGMSKNAMLAARPNLYLTGVSKIGDYGMVEIYKETATTVDAYIYVRNEKVAGYQMW